MKNTLTIAGFDPTGGAGLTSDLESFKDFNLQGLSIATSLTVQDGRCVSSVVAVPGAFLTAQLRALLKTHKVAALKTGMLCTKENARAITNAVKKYKLKNLVVDPVLMSSDGSLLIEAEAIGELKKLIKLARLVTPNLDEAETLTGLKVRNTSQMEEAARLINKLSGAAVLVKGGHLRGMPIDLLFDGRRVYNFKGNRIKGGARKLHGTGCILSSAITAGLARGKSLKGSVEEARKYLIKRIKKRKV